ncbi:MAG TPA: 6-phosphogluconolactonase [Acidimicrobiales bacterium]|nr:6-phosphogluconolactonase [Acidimicrobiales bacterium]
MVPTDLLVEPTAGHAARTAADLVGASLRAAISARGTASIAFSGGQTPTGMLEALALLPLPWQHVHVFQVDERVAPDGDAERNSTALCRALLDRVETNAHLMDVTALDLVESAQRYAALLQRHEPLDVVHLGIGDDGHTASWPPGAPVVDDQDHDVAIVGPFRGFVRMTITPLVVDRSRAVVLLVAGAEKAPVLARMLAGDRSVVASRVLGPRTVIVADEAAATATA